MTIYDILFDMDTVPKKNPDEKPSRSAARFIDYINCRIEWSASNYIREYNRTHSREQALSPEMDDMLEKETDDAVETIERIETMVAIMNEIAQLKKGEQKVYICLYQLDYAVLKSWYSKNPSLRRHSKRSAN